MRPSLFDLLETDLRKGGVPQERILSINMESLEFDAHRDYRFMNRFVKERLPSGSYLHLDEVQAVEGLERLVSSLLAEGSIACIITGSNAVLLSSEPATLLAGYFMEIPIHPLLTANLRSNENSRH
jgi:hypothetical protein